MDELAWLRLENSLLRQGLSFVRFKCERAVFGRWRGEIAAIVDQTLKLASECAEQNKLRQQAKEP